MLNEDMEATLIVSFDSYTRSGLWRTGRQPADIVHRRGQLRQSFWKTVNTRELPKLLVLCSSNTIYSPITPPGVLPGV